MIRSLIKIGTTAHTNIGEKEEAYLQGFFGNVKILELPDDLADNAHVDNLNNHIINNINIKQPI